MLFSCSKEDIPELQNNGNLNLSSVEQEFFDFKKSIGATLRKDKSYRITPAVIKVHQFVLEENSKNKFAEGINTKIGSPYWNHAYTFKTGSDDFYVLVPLYNKDLSIINGYLSGMSSSNGIVLNGMTRTKLLSDLTTNSAIKKSTLTILAKQEKILTGVISPDVDNALCVLREELNTNGIEFEGSEVVNDGSNPCLPELLEICIDQEGGYHWFGGLENLPIHLDHDQDGIINSEDQDWHERRFDLTQEEFTALVLDHWNQNMYDEYGDYYQFWDQMGDYYDEYNDYDGSEIDLSGFFDGFEDFWNDFGDWWSDLWYDIGSGWDDFWGGIGDWFGDLFRDGIECPEWPLQDKDGSISTRSIECFTFYAWDCYDNPDYNWWAFYDGYTDDAVLRFRVLNYLDNVLNGQVDYSTLLDIAQESGCPLDGNFEQCLDWHFNDYRDDLLQYYFEQQFIGYDFLPMVRFLAKNCELGAGTESEYYSCIMNQYNVANENIEEFLTAANIDLSLQEFNEIFLLNCTTCNILNFEEEEEVWKEVINSITGNVESDSEISFLTTYFVSSGTKESLLGYYKIIAEIKEADPLVRWDRTTELYTLFDEEDGLLNECGEVSQWSDLASFIIPSVVNDRVESLGWTNQDIEMGNSSQVNLDYHSINISNLPDLNNDGVGTEKELFDEIRLNWPSYANGTVNVAVDNGPDISSANTWNFYGNDFNDFWNTSNALKTIIEIDTDISGWNPITDDATVICSSFENDCCWVFSTVFANQIGNSNNGSHPVSGNRQFGIKQLANGSYEFYIRAADRARINWVVSSMSWLTGNNSTEIFYEITDQAWNNLMSSVLSLINDPNNGGIATLNPSTILRPDWNKVKDILKTDQPLESIPCKY